VEKITTLDIDCLKIFKSDLAVCQNDNASGQVGYSLTMQDQFNNPKSIHLINCRNEQNIQNLYNNLKSPRKSIWQESTCIYYKKWLEAHGLKKFLSLLKIMHEKCITHVIYTVILNDFFLWSGKQKDFSCSHSHWIF
jgi:hypothetical protein